ncbi:MAG: transposase [Candidatus Aenigmarchaeota archaeon]|nr:transposase [Candidatus Aenigmarchaeota archaeon]
MQDAHAVKYYLKETIQTEQGTITKETKITYAQDWKNYNKAQCNEIKLFDELLKDLVQNIPEPSYIFGRPRLSLRETVFCTVQKVYSQLSSRRVHSLYRNSVEKDMIRKAPHFNAVSKLLNKTELTPILHELIAITAKPLSSIENDFGVDSSGFRTRSFGQYVEYRFNLKRQHKWLKPHLAVGLKTNIVTAVIIGDENSGDSPQFKPLLEATARNFSIKTAVADKAYLSKANYQLVSDLGG